MSRGRPHLNEEDLRLAGQRGRQSVRLERRDQVVHLQRAVASVDDALVAVRQYAAHKADSVRVVRASSYNESMTAPEYTGSRAIVIIMCSNNEDELLYYSIPTNLC